MRLLVVGVVALLTGFVIYLLGVSEKKQLGVQEKHLTANPKVVHPLIGKLPLLYGQLYTAYANLDQLKKNAALYASPDVITPDLALKLSRERARIAKLKGEITAIEDSDKGA